MTKFIGKLKLFQFNLNIFSFFAKRGIFNPVTKAITSLSARIMLIIVKPEKTSDIEKLAKTWQELMPTDAQDKFIIKQISEKTAITEIHIKCPLRGTGNIQACDRLMNYDRTLLERTGGQLIVLESQSNSGKDYCTLAIRKAGESTIFSPINASGTSITV